VEQILLAKHLTADFRDTLGAPVGRGEGGDQRLGLSLDLIDLSNAA
jgi:hypothetical protein